MHTRQNEDSTSESQRPRLQSGIGRLDHILGGGFIRGGTYALLGAPGTGKTILANQICCQHIAQTGGRCVYVTLLAESHDKLVAHLSTMGFYRREFLPDRLFYINGYNILKRDGLSGLLKVLRAEVGERRASMLVLDGLESVRDVVSSPVEFREFLHQLQGYTSIVECTTLLAALGEAGENQPENPMADGVIQLSLRHQGARAVRELSVLKFRGSDYLLGRHELEITSAGMAVYPRTEARFDNLEGWAAEARVRMPFGIQRLDEMLSGGPHSGSATTLLGAPGSGKTTLGLSFLVEGARRGEHGIYFGFFEPPQRLIEKAEGLGLPLKRYVEQGLIRILWQGALERSLDALAEELLERIRVEGHARSRLFIDGMFGIRLAGSYPERVPHFLTAFLNALRRLNVTTLLSEELPLFRPHVEMATPELAVVTDSIILTRYVELRSQLHRLISIMKMRESEYDTSIREFRITPRGIVLEESFQSAERILSGMVGGELAGGAER